jgi:hypothetical protein
VSEQSDDARSRFRQLPEPVRPEDLVETVDTGPPPVAETEHDAATRWLRTAGGGTP